MVIDQCFQQLSSDLLQSCLLETLLATGITFTGADPGGGRGGGALGAEPPPPPPPPLHI